MNNPWTWTDKDEKRLDEIKLEIGDRYEWFVPHSDITWLINKFEAARREIDRLEERVAMLNDRLQWEAMKRYTDCHG
jgi:ubiquinone biosynthesis protein UbiJ